MTGRLRVGIVLITIALAAAVAPALVPVTAGAQTTSPPPTLTLAGQDASTPLGGTFTMQLQTGGNVDGLSLRLTSHERITSRSAFEATVHGESLGSTRKLTDATPVDAFPPEGPYGLRTVPYSLADLNITQQGNGVYPLEVQLRDANDQTVAGFVTHVVVADPASRPLEPLRVAWVWPLVAGPALRADGSANPDVAAELEPGGRLARQAELIGGDSDVPLTLAPSPETLDSWATLATTTSDIGLALGVDDVRRAGATHQVLLGPFVPLDVPALGGRAR